MAGENGEQRAGAAPEGAGGRGDGGPSDTPAPKPVETPKETPGLSIPISVLPKDLQNLPENQIKFVLDKMVEGLQISNRERERLERELQEAKGGKASPKNAEPAEPEKPLEEWLLEDPERALEHWANKRFGPAISKLQEVQDRVGETEFANVSRQFDDFHEYEEDIREILRQSGVEKTRENILGAYTMAVGRKAIDQRGRVQRAAANPETPVGEPTTPPKEYPKTPLSEEIRLASRLSEEEYYEQFSPASPLSIKVPGER